MAETFPTRKSGRQRVPNRKYLDDAFDSLKTVLSSDSEEEEIIQQRIVQDDSDEFSANNVADDQDDEVESLVDDVSDGSEISTPVEEDGDDVDTDIEEPVAALDLESLIALKIPHAAKPRLKQEYASHRNANMHSRGMPENPAKEEYIPSFLELFAGEGLEDKLHMVKARDQWAADVTLPKRSSLGYDMADREDKHRIEATVGWDWYYDQGGREVFRRKQNKHRLDPGDALPYLRLAREHQDLLMGPYGSQKMYNLGPAETIAINEAWEVTEGQSSQPGPHTRGWMVNIGTAVRCMDWAPNHEENMQYLALSGGRLRRHPAPDVPAFTPSPGPAAVQLWAFRTSTEQVDEAWPFLHSYHCNDWGDIRQMKWCPAAKKDRPLTPAGEEYTSGNHIGLLAIICGDGVARVLDIRVDSRGTSAVMETVKYDGSGFAAPPPAGNLSTCLTWLSSTDLAVGYSNGHLAVYDISADLKSGPSETADITATTESIDGHRKPTPWLSMPLQTTYILALESAYPTHPSLLASSSLSGHLRLTSLIAPKTDYVISNRSRSPPTSLAYCDELLSFVAGEESSEITKIWASRCFYATFSVMKLPASPAAGCKNVDVGKHHPTIATGCTDGSVIVTNPLRKILGKKQAAYQQCIFKHEWRPKIDGEIDKEDTNRRSGLSRITEGYKAEKVDLTTRNNLRTAKESVPTTTIFEDETAVTAVAWNPNICCAGWLAVGWGTGLVRVQDVAID